MAFCIIYFLITINGYCPFSPKKRGKRSSSQKTKRKYAFPPNCGRTNQRIKRGLRLRQGKISNFNAPFNSFFNQRGVIFSTNVPAWSSSLLQFFFFLAERPLKRRASPMNGSAIRINNGLCQPLTTTADLPAFRTRFSSRYARLCSLSGK